MTEENKKEMEEAYYNAMRRKEREDQERKDKGCRAFGERLCIAIILFILLAEALGEKYDGNLFALCCIIAFVAHLWIGEWMSNSKQKPKGDKK